MVILQVIVLTLLKVVFPQKNPVLLLNNVSIRLKNAMLSTVKLTLILGDVITAICVFILSVSFYLKIKQNIFRNIYEFIFFCL